MRYTGFCIMSFAVALLLGCRDGSSTSPDTKSKMSIASEKIRDAADATADAAKAKRDDYAREMNKRLDELDVKYAELKARAAKADEQAKEGLEKKIAEAKIKRDLAAKKLDELKTASLDRWEKIKDGMSNAFDDLKKAFD